jgi:hypothetical protein
MASVLVRLRELQESQWGWTIAEEREVRETFDALLEVAEAVEDPFLVLLEQHPDCDAVANAEMGRAAKRLRVALARLEEQT